MPNIKSMKKDLKRNEKRRIRNTAAKSALKTYVKKARTGDGAALTTACKQLDKAAQRGIIHKNQAARRKSRLMKGAAKATAA
jgi:small subunit ribosomal protein S20